MNESATVRCVQVARVLLAAFPLLAGCGENGAGSNATVADSAGVMIVTSSAPRWNASSGWQVSDAPALMIGEPATSEADEFSNIRRVHSLADGTIIVVNARRPVGIRLFSPTGEHIRTIGREGAGPGELRAIWDVWIARPDTIVVFDGRLSRVSYFDPQGTLLETVTFEQRSTNMSWLPWSRFADGTFLMRRNVFIENVDGGSGRSLAPSVRGRATGEIMDTIGVFPETDYYTLPSGYPGFVRYGRRAVLYVSGTSYFRGMGDTFMIDEYDMDGRQIRSIRRAYEPRPITAVIRQQLMDQEVEAARPDRRDAVRQTWIDRPVAETFPAYGETWIRDAAGNLWIQNFATPVDPPAPWSVFDPRGVWLGDVAFAAGFTPHEIGDDYVLGVFRDSLDVETVRRYTLSKDD